MIGGIFTLVIGSCLCSVWDGKYRNKEKRVKVIPIRKIVINTVCIKCQPKYQHNTVSCKRQSVPVQIISEC